MPITEQVERKLGVLQGLITAGLAFIVVFSVSMTGLLLWQSYRVGVQAEDLKSVATQTHTALCAFKQDLAARHRNGVKFLIQHPDGIPGIKADVIRQSLTGEKSTLKALAVLDCN